MMIELRLGCEDAFRLVDSLDASEAARLVVKSLLHRAWQNGFAVGSGAENPDGADDGLVGFPSQSGPQAMEWARARLPVAYKAGDIRRAIDVVVDAVLGVYAQEYRRAGYSGAEYREAAATVARLEAVARAIEKGGEG